MKSRFCYQPDDDSETFIVVTVLSITITLNSTAFPSRVFVLLITTRTGFLMSIAATVTVSCIFSYDRHVLKLFFFFEHPAKSHKSRFHSY